jgi:hypothetical protein
MNSHGHECVANVNFNTNKNEKEESRAWAIMCNFKKECV